MLSPQKKPTLSVFKLVMMSVIAIDSLKNLSSNAQYGPHLIYYYSAALLLFLIPSSLICAELAASVPKSGGAYAWVREAFGNFLAFMTAWMQWLIAITWAPTILTFCVVTFLYLVSPETTQNKIVILLTMLILFWLTLFLIARGIKTSSIISTTCAMFGVLIPMFAITGLGILWLIKCKSLSMHFNILSRDITFSSIEHLRLFVPLLYSLMGMEMIGVHAPYVANPTRQYPFAIFIAAILIALTTLPASFAIAMVIPHSLIQLTTGFIMTATFFLRELHLSYLLPCFVIAIVIGSYGSFYSWLFTVSRYLLTAAEDGSLPALLRVTNQQDMPINLLVFQGIIFTLLAAFFVLMPSVESAFWFFSISCAQFALLYYIVLFSAAIYLRIKQPHLSRPFRVGKSPFFMIILSLIAIATCLSAFVFGFIPPDNLSLQEQAHYAYYLAIIMLMGLALGCVIYHRASRPQKLNLLPMRDLSIREINEH